MEGLVFIICGHGDGDCGAVGNGFQEAERVRALAKKIEILGGENVVIGDTTRNWYRDKLVNTYDFPKGSLILELHMDCDKDESSKGGHVIIKDGFEADKYDLALAELMKEMFPGRASVIVGRSNLANVKRAAKRGYNYRLLECGFISNVDDVRTFNTRMDEFAKGILQCFGIEPVETTPEIPEEKKITVKEWQDAAEADGFEFPIYGADGKWGDECEGVAKKAIVKRRIADGKNVYKYPNLTSLVQKAIGFTGDDVDGKCGDDTDGGITAYQEEHGLEPDGCIGINSWKEILGV